MEYRIIIYPSTLSSLASILQIFSHEQTRIKDLKESEAIWRVKRNLKIDWRNKASRRHAIIGHYVTRYALTRGKKRIGGASSVCYARGIISFSSSPWEEERNDGERRLETEGGQLQFTWPCHRTCPPFAPQPLISLINRVNTAISIKDRFRNQSINFPQI